MVQKERLKRELGKVFHSNLIFLITGMGFFMVYIVGVILSFPPLVLLTVTMLGGVFFYILSVIVVTQLLNNTDQCVENQQTKYVRSMYKYNLLYWRFKTKLIEDNLVNFKETSRKELDNYKFSEERETNIL